MYDGDMAFYTGKGDTGTTKLFDSPQGVRVSKSAPVFECLGQLDELNSITGWCKAGCPDDFSVDGRAGQDILRSVQDHLFTIQAEVAGAPKSIPAESVDAVSALVKSIESQLPEVKTFLVPGGTEYSARLDIARATARRAERRLVTLQESGDRAISDTSRAYINRLSSLFYALTRLANHCTGAVETPPRYADQ